MNNEENNPFTNQNPNQNLNDIFSEQETTKTTKQNNLRWLALTDNFLKEIQEDHEHELTTTDFKMLAYMLQKMDYNNICEIPDQEKINQTLGISVRSISTAIKHLKEWKCITRDKRLTRTFMLNPNYFYRGGFGPQKNKKRQFENIYQKNQKANKQKSKQKKHQTKKEAN